MSVFKTTSNDQGTVALKAPTPKITESESRVAIVAGVLFLTVIAIGAALLGTYVGTNMHTFVRVAEGISVTIGLVGLVGVFGGLYSLQPGGVIRSDAIKKELIEYPFKLDKTMVLTRTMKNGVILEKPEKIPMESVTLKDIHRTWMLIVNGTTLKGPDVNPFAESDTDEITRADKLFNVIQKQEPTLSDSFLVNAFALKMQGVECGVIDQVGLKKGLCFVSNKEEPPEWSMGGLQGYRKPAGSSLPTELETKKGQFTLTYGNLLELLYPIYDPNNSEAQDESKNRFFKFKVVITGNIEDLEKVSSDFTLIKNMDLKIFYTQNYKTEAEAYNAAFPWKLFP